MSEREREGAAAGQCADVCAAKKYGACGTNEACAEKRPNLCIRIIFQ